MLINFSVQYLLIWCIVSLRRCLRLGFVKKLSWNVSRFSFTISIKIWSFKSSVRLICLLVCFHWFLFSFVLINKLQNKQRFELRWRSLEICFKFAWLYSSEACSSLWSRSCSVIPGSVISPRTCFTLALKFLPLNRWKKTLSVIQNYSFRYSAKIYDENIIKPSVLIQCSAITQLTRRCF